MNRFSLLHFPVENKTILLRVDFNVPLRKQTRKAASKQAVEYNYKIKAALPTMKYLLHKNCKIIIATHLGRPQGFSSDLSIKPIAEELRRLLPKTKIILFDDCIGKDISERIKKEKPQAIIILENLRFYKEEEQNDPFFAHSLANLADLYVNDAFGVAHRKHASVDAIVQFLPSAAGLLFEKELHFLSEGLAPKRPAVLILGGDKLNKLGLLELALQRYNFILVGGALAFSFLKAKGIPVGVSKTDPQSVQTAREILKNRNASKIILPLDFIAADNFSPNARTEVVPYNHIRPHQMALDLGPETINLFKKYLQPTKTVVWNGPLGYFKWAKFAAATKEIGRYIGTLHDAATIAGGGETAEALAKFRLQHNFTHVSTGGGAAVAYLSGQKLPAITALEGSYNKFRRKTRKQ